MGLKSDIKTLTIQLERSCQHVSAVYAYFVGITVSLLVDHRLDSTRSFNLCPVTRVPHPQVPQGPATRLLHPRGARVRPERRMPERSVGVRA